jgi:glutathione synthase/RimK-type ligase-like ATP-grasp enzyme
MEHAREEQLAALPPFDLVFNAIGDPDLAAPSAGAVRRFLAQCDRPVLNNPETVARTSRSLTPMALSELEDVVVPPAARIARGKLQRLGLRRAVTQAGFSPPLLVRPIGSHGGKGLARALTWPELEAAAAALGDEDIYVTAYRDYRSDDGLYRKGRVIFVDRRPYPYHWAGSDHWMVHYDASGAGEDAERRDEEMRFLQDPAGFLGPRAWAAIARIGERLDLDWCGLDFGVLEDGRVLVFEANATMLVHPEDEAGPLATKNPAIQAIIEAFQARLGALAEG